MNIAIDGHAASGKSIIAKGIAKKLDFNVFDTGALYRAIACEWDKRNLGESNEQKIAKFIKTIDINIEFINGEQHTFINSFDYTPYLRQEKISVLSSKLSPYPLVREKLRNIQREFAKNNDCVMEGRDIGSEVLPNADFKFFITAPVEVRAKRRFEQQKADDSTPYIKVLEDLKARDFADENRSISPLKTVKDSIIINTAGKSPEESIDECISYIKNKKTYKNMSKNVDTHIHNFI